jgi:hypothetical protein
MKASSTEGLLRAARRVWGMSGNNIVGGKAAEDKEEGGGAQQHTCVCLSRPFDLIRVVPACAFAGDGWDPGAAREVQGPWLADGTD